MFAAERDALKWEAYSGALGIQEREMTVLMSYLDNLGTQAALLAGFAFTCYTDDLGLPDDIHPVLEGLFMICVSTCVGAMLFTVVASTLVSSLGPAMALRGKDGTAMRVAVDHMETNRHAIRNSFGIGVFAFLAIVMQLVWHKIKHPVNSCLCTVIVASIFGFLLFTTHRIFQQFGSSENRSRKISHGGVVSASHYLEKARLAATLPAHKAGAPTEESAYTKCMSNPNLGSSTQQRRGSLGLNHPIDAPPPSLSPSIRGAEIQPQNRWRWNRQQELSTSEPLAPIPPAQVIPPAPAPAGADGLVTRPATSRLTIRRNFQRDRR
ncbi:hypothetical protein AB1Y20_005214 [Prymnesium parvum]|uniref:H(+)-exporting diphosphatase n=1 Tax=Prymnesium parvum TaxID=97485 RepID=A0AB34J2Q6_PRYPA